MQNNEEKDPMEKFPYDFIDKIINLLGEKTDEQTAGDILSECHICHYKELDIDSWIDKYAGDMQGFIDLLQNEWGWKVSYDTDDGVILIDEDKPFCVCPLVQNGNIKNTLLCKCSEGFNRRMFSAVAGSPAKVNVIKSVLRGDNSCVYRIEL